MRGGIAVFFNLIFFKMKNLFLILLISLLFFGCTSTSVDDEVMIDDFQNDGRNPQTGCTLCPINE